MKGLFQEDEIVSWSICIGRDQILYFLKNRRPPIDDPDFARDWGGLYSKLLEQLFLSHSPDLLNQDDAYFLLKHAQQENFAEEARWWYIGAAQLVPERSSYIMREALDRDKYSGSGAGETVFHLLKLCGPSEIPYVTERFYRNNIKYQKEMLASFEVNAPPEILRLLASIIRHPKFISLDKGCTNIIADILEKRAN